MVTYQNVDYVSLGTKAALIKYVKYLITTMKEIGNPVWEVAVVDSVNKMKTLGEDQRKEFFKKLLVERTNTVNETIPNNKLRLFSPHLDIRKSIEQQQLLPLKHDRNLLSTLYFACQVRDADLDDFFKHKNHSFPLSLSDYGNMRLGTKVYLL